MWCTAFFLANHPGMRCGAQLPLFPLKAGVVPGSVFVLGYDTAVRLVHPRYYGGEAGLLLQFARVQAAQCSFLVAGRLDADTGAFRTLDDVPMDPALASMVRIARVRHSVCTPGVRFRVSSVWCRGTETMDCSTTPIAFVCAGLVQGDPNR